MNFNKHSEIEGFHAFMGASNFHWLNYDDKKIEDSFYNSKAKEYGTRLHSFAAEAIKLGQKLPNSKKTLNMYVNDAIGYKMTPEQPLYYSENCFGTCDAICFRDNTLRIHDFKSGEILAHIEQLYIYSALFCLEYSFKPEDISIELRIYQNNDIFVDSPDPNVISEIMSKIIRFDKIINKIKKKEGYYL